MISPSFPLTMSPPLSLNTATRPCAVSSTPMYFSAIGGGGGGPCGTGGAITIGGATTTTELHDALPISVSEHRDAPLRCIEHADVLQRNRRRRRRSLRHWRRDHDRRAHD